MFSISKYLWAIVAAIVIALGLKIWHQSQEIGSLKESIRATENARLMANAELEDLKAKKDRVVIEEVIKYKDKVVYVEKVKTVERIKENAEKINAGCTISNAFVRMHDNIVSARNKNPESADAAGTEDQAKTSGSDRTYDCSAVLEVIDENYKRFQENRVLLESTQDAWTKAGE